MEGHYGHSRENVAFKPMTRSNFQVYEISLYKRFVIWFIDLSILYIIPDKYSLWSHRFLSRICLYLSVFVANVHHQGTSSQEGIVESGRICELCRPTALGIQRNSERKRSVRQRIWERKIWRDHQSLCLEEGEGCVSCFWGFLPLVSFLLCSDTAPTYNIVVVKTINVLTLKSPLIFMRISCIYLFF